MLSDHPICNWHQSLSIGSIMIKFLPIHLRCRNRRRCHLSRNRPSQRARRDSRPIWHPRPRKPLARGSRGASGSPPRDRFVGPIDDLMREQVYGWSIDIARTRWIEIPRQEWCTGKGKSVATGTVSIVRWAASPSVIFRLSIVSDGRMDEDE